MEHSLEDALLILDKWKNESEVIGIITFVVNLEVRMMGKIESVDRDAITLLCGENSYLVVRLKDCAFQYGDPREFPEIPAPPGGHQYAAFLSIQYPPDEFVVLFETTAD
ncbi:MAG: hypothetical protein LAO30_08375 [Acidobacteriia bacterium]|nr:hypothetical protein [Terriglobia bacterium]